MKPNISIALGAGVISAIVFASATTGPTLARMLMLAIVTLPIALAGYAYNARTALLAATIGTLLLGLVTTPIAGAAFALTMALPAAFLVHLALLHRETLPGSTQWYPIGRIALAAALMGASVVAAGFWLAGNDADKLRAAVRASIETMMKSGFAGMPGAGSLGEADLARATDVMMQLLPGVSAAFWMACILVCQWLAARVALASGQLPRPWPDLAGLGLPLGTPLLLGLAVAAALVLDGVPRLIAMGYAGAIYALYTLLGLAIIHHITRGASWRGGALAGVYVLLFVLNTGASLLLALIGLSDSFWPLRKNPEGPPSNTPNSTQS